MTATSFALTSAFRRAWAALQRRRGESLEVRATALARYVRSTMYRCESMST
jgi:hypothetical protein